MIKCEEGVIYIGEMRTYLNMLSNLPILYLKILRTSPPVLTDQRKEKVHEILRRTPINKS